MPELNQPTAFDANKARMMAKNSRTSVSAEVFGKYHKKQAFKPIVIPKNQSTKDK